MPPIELLKKYVGWIVVTLLIILPLFAHLDHHPINLWDESRLAVNAFEMAQNGNLIVTKYLHQPDLWNTKPPLMIWLQVLCIKTVGYNELAIRLPSAIAAAFTCFLLYWFLACRLKNQPLGILAVIVLVTAGGYVDIHAARTGDYDALLTLFTTAYCLLYYYYLESGSRRVLICFFVMLTLAVLTKGVAGLLFLPALLLYSFFRKQTLAMFRTPQFWLGVVLCIGIAGGYYLLREHYNPGYLHAVNGNELGGRYSTALENHTGDGCFYTDLLIDEDFCYWYLLIVPGAVLGLLAKNPALRRLTLFTIFSVVTLFTIISTAGTKLTWYHVPAFPFLAILVALFLSICYQYLVTLPAWQSHLRVNAFPIVVLAIAIYPAYSFVVDRNMNPHKPQPGLIGNFGMANYLKTSSRIHSLDTGIYFVGDADAQNIVWYRAVLNSQNIYPVFIGLAKIEPGQKLLVFDEKDRQDIERRFYTRNTVQENGVTYYQIDSLQPNK